MKDWEQRILTSKKKNNTYAVSCEGVKYLCNKINGEYYVKNEDKTELTDVSHIIKL